MSKHQPQHSLGNRHSTMKSSNISSQGWIARAAAGVVAVIIGLAMVVQDADAARMGGGRSFGRQSPNVTKQASPPAQQAGQKQTPPPAAQPQPAGNRWLGPIAGIAA